MSSNRSPESSCSASLSEYPPHTPVMFQLLESSDWLLPPDGFIALTVRIELLLPADSVHLLLCCVHSCAAQLIQFYSDFLHLNGHDRPIFNSKPSASCCPPEPITAVLEVSWMRISSLILMGRSRNVAQSSVHREEEEKVCFLLKSVNSPDK